MDIPIILTNDEWIELTCILERHLDNCYSNIGNEDEIAEYDTLIALEDKLFEAHKKVDVRYSKPIQEKPKLPEVDPMVSNPEFLEIL